MNERLDPDDLKGFSLSRELYEWVESGVFAVLCVVLVFTFIARTVSVEGESMLPTLKDSDRLVSSRLFYTPKYGDIVVVTKPYSQNEPIIKRIIATEGQTVDIDFNNGVVYVDGKELKEPYTADPTHMQYDISFPQTVPPGHVFVMGDNRNHSFDSRASAIGMVDERYLLGRILYRVMPYDNIGLPDDYWK